MAEHTHTTSRRSALALGAGAFASVGITAGVAASAAPAQTAEFRSCSTPNPDAELLAFRRRLDAAIREVSAAELTHGALPPGSPYKDVDAWIGQAGDELAEVCEAIVGAEPPRTAEGRALQAAAAMHQLRFSYSHGCWPGLGEELAWDVLSALAGDVYVPPTCPDWLTEAEPERAGA